MFDAGLTTIISMPSLCIKKFAGCALDIMDNIMQCLYYYWPGVYGGW